MDLTIPPRFRAPKEPRKKAKAKVRGRAKSSDQPPEQGWDRVIKEYQSGQRSLNLSSLSWNLRHSAAPVPDNIRVFLADLIDNELVVLRKGRAPKRSSGEQAELNRLAKAWYDPELATVKDAMSRGEVFKYPAPDEAWERVASKLTNRCGQIIAGSTAKGWANKASDDHQT